MDTGEIIAGLKKYGRFYEVYQKTTFECIREDKSGNTQEVEVSILDAGPDEDTNMRFGCRATTKDGKMATGNPHSTIDMALLNVHWYDLDKEGLQSQC